MRQLGVDHQHQRRTFDDLADVGEVLDRVVGHLDVVEVLRVGDRIGVQRVAVRLRAQYVRGADRAEPPVLFSTTTGTPSFSCMTEAKRRTGTSVKPPCANGTTIVMARLG